MRLISSLIALALAFGTSACGSDLQDGFDEYRVCDDGNEACVQIKFRSLADNYETELVSETDTEVRIKAVASGTEFIEEESIPSRPILLTQPLGDRLVIDDIRDRVATLVPF